MLRELNQESLLLMYLAEELSAADRAQVDRMLAQDPQLRGELQRLQGTMHWLNEQMQQLDAVPVAADAGAARRIGQAMRQHQAAKLARVSAAAQSRPLIQRRKMRYPMWAYPSAVAAALIVALIGWWGHRPDATSKLPRLSNTVAVNPMPDEEVRRVEDEVKQSFETPNPMQPPHSVASLESAEYQLAELSRSREAFAPSGFGFGDHE